MTTIDLGLVASLSGTNILNGTYTASGAVNVGRAKRVRLWGQSALAAASNITTTTVKISARYANFKDPSITTGYVDLPSYLDDVQGSQPKGPTFEITHVFTTPANTTTPWTFYLNAEDLVDITISIKGDAVGNAADVISVYATAAVDE